MANSALGQFITGCPGLLESIQEVAHKDGRMANQMAERAVRTLRDLADGKEVGPEDLEHAMKLLEFVSKGSLDYVQRIQESRVPHWP